MNEHRQIWNRFCERHNVPGTWVPLFNTSPNGTVLTKRIGNTRVHNVLRRSDDMEAVVRRECAKLTSDWQEKTSIYDGLLYIIAVEDGGSAAPLYIGRRRVDIRLDSGEHFFALTDVKAEALPDPEVKWNSPFLAVNKSVVTMVSAIKE
jgi:hypothetical protein